MEKLLIIDGHNLLFQMFFGMPSRIVNKDGRAIQGTLGFVGALIKIIKMTAPTHVVALFDREQENDRTNLDTQYKNNRVGYSMVPSEDNPFSQLPDIYKALDFMGIMHTEVVGTEADDVIAGYVFTYAHQMKVIISSFDSDFFQLINDHTSVLRYRGDKTMVCDAQYVKSKYGVLPEQYADFKSLTGDSSDNIRGAEKVGPKTAAQLIHQMGTITQIIENCDLIVKPSVRESIKKSSERLVLNHRLIKLDNKVDLPFTLEQMKYRFEGFTTIEVLRKTGLK